jgi:Bacteriophage probable baseplate hub protein
MSLGLAAMSGRAPKRLRAYCRIYVEQTEITTKIDPYLIKVRVIDKQGSMDEAHIEVDDRYGRLKIPELGDSVKIGLGWRDDGTFITFEGAIADVDHFGQKKQGRRMEWVCSGTNFLKMQKQQIQQTWQGEKQGEKISLEKVIKDIGKMVEINNIKIDPKVNSIMEGVWMMTGESPISFLNRIGQQYGLITKWANKDGQTTLSITPKDSNTNAEGQDMPTIQVVAGMWGVDANLIAWRIKPISARPQQKETSNQFFEMARAQWDRYIHEVPIGEGGWFGKSDTRFTEPSASGSEQSAKGQSENASAESTRKRGYGWVVIDGEPQAQPQGKAEVSGIRQGIDGKFRIVEAEHTYVKSGGFTTRLELDQGQPLGSVSQTWEGSSTGPAQSGAAGPPAAPNTGATVP